MKRRVGLSALTALAAAALAATTGLTGLPAASASGTPQATEVSAVPQSGTPNIQDGVVYAITQVGSTVIVGGSFTKTESPWGSGTIVSTPYILAFDATSGVVKSAFAPQLTGGSPSTVVQALQPGPTPGTVYVGGIFNKVDGVTAKGLTLLNVADGSRVTTFNPPNFDLANVQTMKQLGNRLYVGGAFTKVIGGAAHAGIATIDATTGALDPFMNSQVAGHHSWTPSSPSTAAKAAVAVNRLDITPDGSKLVAIGNFKTVDGSTHDQIAMWDLTGASATLRPWNTTKFQPLCATGAYDSYVRDVAFSPDGSYFVVTNTGGYGTGTSLCDSASRWETGATGSDVPYTWVDYTGKDTLLSVAITGTVVYVGGHERWLNNPAGNDQAGPGAVPRPGVAALDPATGLPLSWNPGRSPRGAGTYALLATPTGLWMGSDTDFVGDTLYHRGKIAFFPLAGGKAVAGKAVPSLPGTVVAGTVPAASAPAVLARVNAGGPLLRSTDAGPDWQADTASTSTLHNSGSFTTSYPSPVTFLNGSLPPGTPPAVFSTERYDPGAKGDGKEMQWHFPGIAAGTQVDVRLYFANRTGSTQGTGKRTFDISIDGVTKTANYDISASAGDQTGTLLTFPVTSDGTVDIAFTHEIANPEVNAIEIVRSGTGPYTPPAGSLSTRTFNGSTAGAAQPVSSPLDPATVRGAMVVGGQLFYGKTDGNLYKRTVAGGGWGTETLVDPYNDPYWSTRQTGSGNVYRGTKPDYFSKLTNVTSMSFDGVGRMYYTLYAQTGLYSRTFNPDSGVMGTDESVVPGTLPSNVTGAFLSGSSFYYATSDGTLRVVGFDPAAGLTGTPQVVSGPAKDGVDWSSPVLYLNVQNQPPTASASISCTDLTCSADGSGSSDSDGSIATYTWAWGDGTTTATASATTTHTYPGAGTWTVGLTVTDNGGASSATTTQFVTTTSHTNVPPTASYTVSCRVQTCTFDGTGSRDSDGTVTGWSWAFGDGSTGTGATVSHTYDTGGTYTVGLTVTDDASATGTTTQSVPVQTAPASPIAFRGSSSVTTGSTSLVKVAVPAAVQAGDALLLKVDTTSTSTNPTPPAGWTEIDRATFASSSSLQVIWQRVATASDAGTTVQVPLAVAAKATAQLLAYSGTAASSPASATSAVDTPLTSTHTAPATTVATAGSWVLWSWTDKSSATTAWTPAPGVTTRASGYGTGTGYLTTVVGDAGPVPAGSSAAQPATSSPGTSRGVMTTIVLSPAT